MFPFFSPFCLQRSFGYKTVWWSQSDSYKGHLLYFLFGCIVRVYSLGKDVFFVVIRNLQLYKIRTSHRSYNCEYNKIKHDVWRSSYLFVIRGKTMWHCIFKNVFTPLPLEISPVNCPGYELMWSGSCRG